MLLEHLFEIIYLPVSDHVDRTISFIVGITALAHDSPLLFFLILLFLDFVRFLNFCLHELIIFLWQHEKALDFSSEHLHT